MACWELVDDQYRQRLSEGLLPKDGIRGSDDFCGASRFHWHATAIRTEEVLLKVHE